MMPRRTRDSRDAGGAASRRRKWNRFSAPIQWPPQARYLFHPAARTWRSSVSQGGDPRLKVGPHRLPVGNDAARLLCR